MSQSNSKHKFITEMELAERWRMSRRTLQRRRASGNGLPFQRLIGRVRYKLEDIVAFENANRIEPTP